MDMEYLNVGRGDMKEIGGMVDIRDMELTILLMEIFL